MCGLWGAFSEKKALSSIDIQRATTLAVLSELRGMDSAGYVCLFEDNSGKTLCYHDKEVVTASQMLYANPKINEIGSKTDLFALFGHSRAATIGEVIRENAHPYKVKHILGMHNGTVHKLGNDTKTDSQEIFEMLAEDGLEKTLGEIKYGAYALVYVDYNDNSLNIIKNKERPLVICKAATDTYFWSSEWPMMEFMQKRHNTCTYGPSMFLAENELFRFDLKTRALTKRMITPKSVYYSSVPAIPSSGMTYFEKKLAEDRAKYEAEREADTAKDDAYVDSMAGLSKKQKRRLRQKLAMERKAKREAAPVALKPLQSDGAASHKTALPGLPKDMVYRGFRGRPMTAQTATQLLDKGCKIYGVKHTITEKVYWISNEGYVGEDAVKDGVLQGYGIKEAHASIYKPEGL